MQPWIRLFSVMIAFAVLASCTRLEPIRIYPPGSSGSAAQAAPLPRPMLSPSEAAKGRTGTPTVGENRQIIEEYEKYFIGYAEFDDQGWSYANSQQIEVIKDRVAADLADPKNSGKDFLVLVFIHGWHHNAHDNDGNVQQFRQMVDIAANNLEAPGGKRNLRTSRRVIGIYVGWRGESVNAVPFNYFTVIDRRNAAQRVAQGAVRQLFANLRIQEFTEQGVFGEGCPKPEKMRTVVIGHSFGGLIAFTALAQAELNELTLAKMTKLNPCDPRVDHTKGGHLAPLWPDGLILINPAFEASRYDSFAQLVKPPTTSVSAQTSSSEPASPAANPPPDTMSTERAQHLIVPHFIVVASKTDDWTGKYFTAGRVFGTLFEGYDRTDHAATSAERDSNQHSIARVDAYRTHELDLDSNDTNAVAVAHLVDERADKKPLESPVWVVMANDRVVHGHDGFLYGAGNDKAHPQPYLANWLLQVFDMDCSVAPEMTCR